MYVFVYITIITFKDLYVQCTCMYLFYHDSDVLQTLLIFCFSFFHVFQLTAGLTEIFVLVLYLKNEVNIIGVLCRTANSKLFTIT